MVAKILIIASVASVISLTNGLSAPFITPCKSADGECAKQNAITAIPLFAAGIPDLGVQTLDPIFFKNVDSSSPNLKFLLSDITMKGLKSCKPIKVQRDVSKSNIFVKLTCEVQLDGNYELDGQLLILKIAGKGKIHVFLRHLDIEVTLDIIKKEGKDGKEHIRVTKFDHSYNLKEKSDVVFEGLFQDNAVLSQAAADLIKNSGNEIVQEIGGEMFKTSLTAIVETFNHFFAKVPYNELSLD